LIGRKIDCPKCKYRFVVEDPGETAEVDEEVESPKAAKRPRRDEEDEARASKNRPGKAKAGPRGGSDDDEDGETAGKSAGNSTKLILWVGLGVGAVLLLCVVGYFIIYGGESSTPKRASSRPSSTPVLPATDVAESKPVAVSSSVSLEGATNLLPPEAEGISVLRMPELLSSALGRTIFNSPGAFHPQSLQKKLGFSPEDVDLVLQAWNFSQNWSFNVIHLTKAVVPADLKAAFHLAPAPKKIAEQEYFLLDANPWLDELGRETFARALQVNATEIPSATRPLALRIFDPKTLVIANVSPLEEFLKVKGQYPRRAPAQPAAATAPSKPETDPATSTPNLKRRMLTMGGPGERTPTEPTTPAPVVAAPPSPQFMTISASLKKMIDRVDAKQPTFSMAIDTQAAEAGHVPPLGLNTLDLRQNLVKDGAILGISFNIKDRLSILVASEFPDEEVANLRAEAFRKDVGNALANRIGEEFKTKVVVPNSELKTTTPGQPDNTTPGLAQPGGAPSGKRPGLPGLPPLGGVPPNMGARREGGAPSFFPGAPGNQSLPTKEETNDSTVRATLQDKNVVVLQVDLIDHKANYAWMMARLRQLVLQHKGSLDMAGGRPRVFELARALRAYLDSHAGQFPRGTQERPLAKSRAGRPYPPDQRISWMVELLPYLGPDKSALYGRINRQKSWRDPENLTQAGILIPQFLDVQYPRNTWWVRYPGMGANEEVAATHFVGITGIGLDAGYYDPADPATTKKLGIFGYDRATHSREISDGLANTIAIIQVPATFKRPWLAGGGSTLQGATETHCIQPFVSTTYNGKNGTMAIMGDGTVRFLPETISDDLFKALCTIKGGEQVIIDRDAPKVPEPDDTRELKTAEAISPIAPQQLTSAAPAPAAPAGRRSEK